MNRIFGLDLMRSLAIILVLLSHGKYLLNSDFSGVNYLGFLGVEIFFVLSGFLIGGILIRQYEKKFDLHEIKKFWKKRWFRTIPLYLLFLCIEIALSFKHGNAFNAISQPWRYLIFMQNFAWEQPDFFTISWSLAIEEWFYLILPVILLFTNKFLVKDKKRNFFVTTVSVILIITLVRCFYVLLLNPEWDVAVRRIVIFRLDSMMYGVFAAFLFHYYRNYWSRFQYQLVAIGTIFILISLTTYSQNSLDDSFFSRTFLFSLTSVGASCFLPFLNSWNISTPSLINTAVTSISLWSYSIYLSHPIILGRLMGLSDKMPRYYLIGVGLFLIYLFLSVLISSFSFYYFEMPVTNLRDAFSLSFAGNGDKRSD
jgi:peptidoglycan/LPS O-acetylase OafA/YrhL